MTRGIIVTIIDFLFLMGIATLVILSFKNEHKIILSTSAVISCGVVTGMLSLFLLFLTYNPNYMETWQNFLAQAKKAYSQLSKVAQRNRTLFNFSYKRSYRESNQILKRKYKRRRTRSTQTRSTKGRKL